MNKENVDKIWMEVRENHDRLRNCQRPHDFEMLPEDPNRKWDRKYICRKCLGVISGHDYAWYKKGLEDGIKKMSEIGELK